MLMATLHKKIARLPLEAMLLFIDDEISKLDSDEYFSHYALAKSNVLRGMNRTAEAVELLTQCFVLNPPESVFFFAGQYSLENQDYSSAIVHLTLCIDSCLKTGDQWYLDSAYLLRAYGAAKVGNEGLAENDLKFIGNNHAMGWVEATPCVSEANVLAMLRGAKHYHRQPNR